MNIWQSLVEEYTKRKITYPRDRLPAISGIASKLRLDGNCHGRYAAGLWEGDLDFQITWEAAEQRNTTYREPTEPSFQIPT